MKNSLSSFKKEIVSRYLVDDNRINQTKTANINILLNRVKLDKKREKIKKLLFSAATSACVLLFVILIF